MGYMGARWRRCSLTFVIVCCVLVRAVAAGSAPPRPRHAATHDTIQIQSRHEDNITVDMFTGRAPDASRNNLTDTWKWDFWCQLQPEIGKCKNNITKYYYDSQLDQCLTFRFSGCEGNRNRFDSRVDCDRYCRGAAFVPIKPKERGSICSLQPSAGACVGYFPKYYYDVNSGRCKTFMYGGCGGNANQFPAPAACAAHCAGVGAARAGREPRARASRDTASSHHQQRLTLNSSLGISEFI